MSERTTKQSFLNFIFKETVLSGNFWSREWEGRKHPDLSPDDEANRRVRRDGTGVEGTLSL